MAKLFLLLMGLTAFSPTEAFMRHWFKGNLDLKTVTPEQIEKLYAKSQNPKKGHPLSCLVKSSCTSLAVLEKHVEKGCLEEKCVQNLCQRACAPSKEECDQIPAGHRSFCETFCKNIALRDGALQQRMNACFHTQSYEEVVKGHHTEDQRQLTLKKFKKIAKDSLKNQEHVKKSLENLQGAIGLLRKNLEDGAEYKIILKDAFNMSTEDLQRIEETFYKRKKALAVVLPNSQRELQSLLAQKRNYIVQKISHAFGHGVPHPAFAPIKRPIRKVQAPVVASTAPETLEHVEEVVTATEETQPQNRPQTGGGKKTQASKKPQSQTPKAQKKQPAQTPQTDKNKNEPSQEAQKKEAGEGRRNLLASIRGFKTGTLKKKKKSSSKKPTGSSKKSQGEKKQAQLAHKAPQKKPTLLGSIQSFNKNGLKHVTPEQKKRQPQAKRSSNVDPALVKRLAAIRRATQRPDDDDDDDDDDDEDY